MGAKVKFKNKPIYQNKPVPIRKYSYWAFISFFLGFIGFLVEIRMQGGIMNAIANIELVRGFKGHEIQNGASNPLVPLRLFKPFMYFSFFMFYLLLKHKKTLLFRFMTFITFLLSAYLLFIGGGRTHIVLFLASIFIGFLFSRKKKRKKTSSIRKVFAIGILAMLGAVSLVVLDPIFAYLTYGRAIDFSDTSSIDSILGQFSFPYSNVAFTISNEFNYRLFQDLFVWVIISLPAFLTSRVGLTQPTPLYEYNTLLQNGTMIRGGIPDDILTFGMYQLGLTGVVVTLIIFGVLMARLDSLIKDLKNYPQLIPILFRVVVYIGMMVMYADLEGTFRGRFDVFLLIIFLYDYRKYINKI